MRNKIILFKGSPRKNGNTNTITDWVIESAKSNNAEIKSIDTSNINYKTNGCICCLKCQLSKEYKCVIDDEASEIIHNILGFNIIIYSTPVYFCGPTAQIKLLIDRQFSLIKVDYQTRKPIFPENRPTKLGLIATAAKDKEFGLEAIDLAFKSAAIAGSCDYSSLLFPNAIFLTPIFLQDKTLKKKSYEYGEKIANW